MQSSLKKSLYLGLAAASFVAAAGATTANASAKAATVKSDVTMTTAATSRNVTLTGTNAVYTKPGTVKGAKVVASTVTAKKLAESNKGAANFRAYRVAVTDRGSVYYKVVSFDGAYRGYVYGGKSTSDFAGGLTAYNTTKDATAPKSTDVFNLTAATSKDANTLFYAQPAYAQYKIGRATVNGSVLKATDKYAGASFTFDKAVTTSREGETWYEIASTKLSDGTTTNDLNGAWVKASNVKNPKADPEATNDNSIKVVYRDATTKNTVAEKTFVTNSTTTKAGNPYDASQVNNAGQTLQKFAQSTENLPAGYAYSSAETGAVYGGSYVVNVAQAATSKASLYLEDPENTFTSFDKGTLFNTPSLPAAEQAKLTGVKGADAKSVVSKLATYLAYGKDKATGTKTAFYAKTPVTVNGKLQYQTYVVNMSKTVTQNPNFKYGDTLKVVLDKDALKDSLPSSTDNGNSDFLN